MAREWNEETAKRLCYGAGAVVLLCLAVIGGRVAAYRNLWRPPEFGMAGSIALWVCLALALLFGMDRGIPREGTWGFRLFVLRRVLVVAVFATIAVIVYLK